METLMSFLFLISLMAGGILFSIVLGLTLIDIMQK